MLTYHRFRDAPGDPFSVSAGDFRRQMEWVAKQGIAISLTEFLTFLNGQTQVRDGSVLITIDDGYRDVGLVAAPILSSLAIPWVAFIPVAEVAATRAVADDQTRPRRDGDRLSWAEVIALADTGVSIGSHSREHRSLGRMREPDIQSEAHESRMAIEHHVGHTPVAFAYPFGTRADFDERTRRIVRDVGYSCAFTSQHGAVSPRSDHHELPRVKVEGGDGLWLFKLLVKGGLDLWILIDRTLWWLQASRDGVAPPFLICHSDGSRSADGWGPHVGVVNSDSIDAGGRDQRCK